MYDHLADYFPRRSREQLVYFSNILCLAIAEFHLTSGCTTSGICSPVLPQIVEAELPPLDAYLHEHEVGTQDMCILSEAAIKHLRVWLHRVNMTVRYDEARADSPHDEDHKLGALLDYFLMPNNTGVTLEDILCRVVVENVNTLQVCLVKCKKVLKEVTKTQGKLLTKVVKLKITLEKSHPKEVTHKEASEALHQATGQLVQVRDTITHHTVEIVRIEELLRERESTEEESSSPEEGLLPGSGSRDSPAPVQQEQDDFEMEDVENTSNLPQGMATQTNPIPEEMEDDPDKTEDDPSTVGGVDPPSQGDEQIIIEGGGTTPITPAEDQLLGMTIRRRT